MNTENRLEKLERRCRTLTIFVAALLLTVTLITVNEGFQLRQRDDLIAAVDERVAAIANRAEVLEILWQGAFVDGWTDDVPDLVAARNFVLVGDDGQLRATLYLHHGEPWLQMLDSNGITRVALGAGPGPGLMLYGADRAPRVELSGGPGAGLALHDAAGRLRLLVGTSENGSLVAIQDQSGELIWSAPPKP